MINLFITSQEKYKVQTTEYPKDIKLVGHDFFSGTGEVTVGIEDAEINNKKTAIVISAVNHDPKAITSHYMNHPNVVHFKEDIKVLATDRLIKISNDYRKAYPHAKTFIWASLECTNFSRAKGGQPRDADSRTLANHLVRYIEDLDPDYIFIENVVEFKSWGPLCENGRPVSKNRGEDYLNWIDEVNSYGYRDEWHEMNSADYGAYTSRNRLFGCFAKDDLPIVWPKPTHSKKTEKNADCELKDWKAVREVLDLDDHGQSIFTRKKPLVDASLARIFAGLKKYAAKGKDAFIAQYNSGSENNRVLDLDKPCNVIPTNNRFSLIQTPFLTKYYGNGENIQSVDDPAGTITTKDRFAFVTASWLDKQYSGPHNHQSIDQPAGTLMTTDKHSLASAEYFILNPSHGGHCMHIDQPCPVIVARQDKAPLYLIRYEMDENIQIAIYDTDSDIMIKIKKFMALHGISDILMRMLKVEELLRIQGFPEGYKLFGNQGDRKKFIGNSVVPQVVKSWFEALGEALNDSLIN